MWVNSLKIQDVHVNNLFEDIKDGLVLLKVLDRVEPGCVDWKKVEMKPNLRIKKIGNANYAVDIGKNMKFSLVNVGGIDLVDGKKKLALALIWQMVRKHTLQVNRYCLGHINILFNLKSCWEAGMKINCSNGLWKESTRIPK
jgi:plastin-1